VTFSIVAYDPAHRAWGVAVASRFLAVGAFAPSAEVEVGALTTQAWSNPVYRKSGLNLLRAGNSAAATLSRLMNSDPERDRRQLGIVDRHGDSASWTGKDCRPFAGDRTGHGFAVQGNTLTGPEVLDSMTECWRTSSPDVHLALRLLAVLAAGDSAGGDRRGRQSAALLVARHCEGYFGWGEVEMDLRVDDAADPIPALSRLVGLHFTQTHDDD
jgi:uncharacterized Ntn-hydrolase superfamily protein